MHRNHFDYLSPDYLWNMYYLFLYPRTDGFDRQNRLVCRGSDIPQNSIRHPAVYASRTVDAHRTGRCCHGNGQDTPSLTVGGNDRDR